MFKRIIVFLTVTLITMTSLADELKIRAGAPERYVVKKGDTLWDLSAIYLTKPWLWPKLWGINPQIKNPHLIYPGDVISLTFNAQGEPRLTVNSRVIKLSPKIRTTSKIKTAIPTLPLRLIRPYISYEQSLDGEYLDGLPYILGSNENSKNWITGQTLYASQPLEKGKTYAIYRKGQAYTNIGEDEPLGYETALVATAKVIRSGDTKGNPAALHVIKSLTEIRAGDKVLPVNQGQMQPVFFKMTKPDGPLDATIIASPSNFREYSKYDIVVINTGRAKVGNMLDIYHRSPTVVNDPDGPKYFEDSSRFAKMTGSLLDATTDGTGRIMQMPKEKIGELMVFKVYDKLSYAFVTAASRPIRVGDTIQAP